jgi:hypothetical protein
MKASVSLAVLALGCTLDPARAFTPGESALPARSEGLASVAPFDAIGTPEAAPGAEASVRPAAASVEDEAPGPEEPLSRGALFAAWNALRGDAYPLDSVERWLDQGARVTCDQSGLSSYRGNRVRYAGSVLVNPAFRERLERFEVVVAEVAREVYGREPTRLRHYGAFSCRPTRNRARLVSEHALGNALDVVGFDFGPATRTSPLNEGLPAELQRSFQVRVARHWSATKGAGAVHARFFALLTDRLRDRSDIFRSMFGPGHGGHDDHLHLDVSPWRYVDL